MQYLYVQGGGKKNGTQTTLNNFFVIWSVTLQFTHITLQHVQFPYLKGFFPQIKGIKVIVEKQKNTFSGIC